MININTDNLNQDQILAAIDLSEEIYSELYNIELRYKALLDSDEETLSPMVMRGQLGEYLFGTVKHEYDKDIKAAIQSSKDRLISKNHLLSEDRLISKNHLLNEDRLISKEKLHILLDILKIEILLKANQITNDEEYYLYSYDIDCDSKRIINDYFKVHIELLREHDKEMFHEICDFIDNYVDQDNKGIIQELSQKINVMIPDENPEYLFLGLSDYENRVFSDSDNFDFFDRMVYTAIVSILDFRKDYIDKLDLRYHFEDFQCWGNVLEIKPHVITIQMIFNVLSGKTKKLKDDDKHQAMQNILESIRKMQTAKIVISKKDARFVWSTSSSKGEFVELLECSVSDTVLNERKTKECVIITEVPALYTLQLKYQQFQKIKATFLDTSKCKGLSCSTKQSISLKGYILSLIAIYQKNQSQETSILLEYETLFKILGAATLTGNHTLSVRERRERTYFRNITKKYLNFLMEQGLIKKYEDESSSIVKIYLE